MSWISPFSAAKRLGITATPCQHLHKFCPEANARRSDSDMRHGICHSACSWVCLPAPPIVHARRAPPPWRPGHGPNVLLTALSPLHRALSAEHQRCWGLYKKQRFNPNVSVAPILRQDLWTTAFRAASGTNGERPLSPMVSDRLLASGLGIVRIATRWPLCLLLAFGGA